MKRRRRNLTEADLRYLNLPEEYWRVKISGVQASIRPTIEKYLTRLPEMVTRPAGIMLGGLPGVGKTSIAAVVLKEARAQEFTGFFLTTWDLREFVRSKVDFDESSSILDRCRDVDVLVLDNLRAEDAKDGFVNERFIEELIAARSAKKRVTIVTTSMTFKDLEATMPKLMSRIKDTVVYLNVGGEDLRAAAARALKNDLVVIPGK